MASIETYLAEIRNAILGEEVRGSIINAIDAINEEAVSLIPTKQDIEDAKTAAMTAVNAETEMRSTMNSLQTKLTDVLAFKETFNSQMSEIFAARQNMLTEHSVEDLLLDSSGNSVSDNSGKDIVGRVVFAEAGAVAALINRVSRLEKQISTLTKHLLLDSTY